MQHGQFALDQPSNILLTQAQGFQLLNGRLHKFLSFSNVPTGLCDRFADESTGTMFELDDIFVLELPIDPNYGVGIDDEISGEISNRWELITRTQRADGHCMLDLFHELDVNRNPGIVVQTK